MCDDVIYREEYKGFTIEIEPDSRDENPFKEWDMLGKLIVPVSEKWRDLGQVDQFDGEDELVSYFLDYDWQEFPGASKYYRWYELPAALIDRMWAEIEKRYVIRTVTFLDGPYTTLRSSRTIGDESDSYYFVSREDVLKEWGGKYLTRSKRAQADKCLKGDLDALRDWLEGSIYGYRVLDADGELIDSVWGYYGDYDGPDGALAAAREAADWEAMKVEQEAKAEREAAWAQEHSILLMAQEQFR